MGLTITYGERQNLGSQFAIPFTATFDDSYLTTGEVITASYFALDRFENVMIEDSEGYTFDVDVATGGATASIKAYSTLGDKTAENIELTDSNTAGTDGVAVYLHTKNGVQGWFEFVSPTNADGNGTLSTAGNSYFIFDADGAATDGVAIYFDEDATIQDERLMAVCPSNQDIYVPVGGNQFIKIKDNDDAASTGVQVYFDEDSTNTNDRLLFISPTNTDGTGATDDEYRPLAGVKLSEVASTTDLSGLTINGVAYGR